ncbi:MAG: Methyltransferase type 11 [Bacillales bacterium]|jgi:2-polyprenyl-3-methyl-5-hydroxy-6-metoxy-1,4-benzoquinol methylase|nr:Methyltransferase type 11 [Bacillales bacterium]
MSYLFQTYASSYDRFMQIFKLDKIQDLLNSIENSKPKVIADIGGGTGTLANELIKLGHSVTIIDPCQKMTDIARLKNPQITIKNILFDQERDDCHYDIVIIRDCLHHIKEQEMIIKKAFQVLKPKGHLIIQDFSPYSIQTKLLFLFERSLSEKVYPIPVGELDDLCCKNGFTTVVKRINKRDYILIGEKNA